MTRDPRTEQFLSTLVGKSQASIWTYRSAINKFLRYCGRREPSVTLAQKWLAMLERVEKLNPNSIHFYGIVIKMYLRKTGRDVEKLDQISLPKQEPPRREHIAPEDWDRFLNAIDSKDDRLVFELLLYTGIRVGGLLMLRPQDIHWKERTLYVYQTQPVPATKEVLTGLSNMIRDNRFSSAAYMFAGWTEKMVGQKLRFYAKKAGLRNADRLVPHSMRHSFAIRFIQESTRPSALEDLRSFLGHARLSTTEQYLTYSMKEGRNAYDKVFSTKKQGAKRR